MAMTNAERQAKWLEKNRAVFNLRRRNARKDQGKRVPRGDGSGESRVPNGGAAEAGDNPPTLNPFETKKVGEFRMLVLSPKEVENEPVVLSVKPLVFRDDNGRVISERAWNTLQKLKEKAKENEYEIDDYIQ
jgi:Ni/Co efflux regulator RcnB